MDDLADAVEVVTTGSFAYEVADHGLSLNCFGVSALDLRALAFPVEVDTGECVEVALSVVCRAVDFSLAGIVLAEGDADTDRIFGMCLTGINTGVRVIEAIDGTYTNFDTTPSGAAAGTPFMPSQELVRMRVTNLGGGNGRIELGDGTDWSQHGLDWEWALPFSPPFVAPFVSNQSNNFPVFARFEYLRVYTP